MWDNVKPGDTMRPISCLRLCSLVVCGATLLLRPLSAQEPGPSASARSAAAEYLTVSGLDDVGRLALRIDERSFVDRIAGSGTERVRDSVRAFAARYVTWDSVRDDAVRMLAEQFTEKELDDMLGFLQSEGGALYAKALATAARRYLDSDLPVDTIAVRYAHALDGLRGTDRQAADIRRFAGTPLGGRVIRLPSEIIALGNREFIARLKPRLSVMQTMIEGAIPGERPHEADFSRPGVAVRDGRPSSNEPLFEFTLDKGAAPIPTAARLRYPEKLRAANVEGEVVVQFVVDTNGRADTSKMKVIRSSHELFTAAVKELLPELRFTPAEVGKHKVSELVQQPFTFSLDRTKAPVARKARRP